ncbi:hypothetical protein EV356DRAFT_344720 [Viridothelium virens]|uniref:Uncharacterized protein n=1 Tax=Viridothelium virens TaxID=1048519 RepID=A0A6A6GX88_VIRVR|nr:hypothetical protein EV356DRAFT_344720 [Viridothelium virens]
MATTITRPASLQNQSPTNLGPLTTTFTPPASCSPILWWDYQGDVHAYSAQACFEEGIVNDSLCWPSRANETRNFESFLSPLQGYGVYSPGYICPIGYTSACANAFSGQITALRTFAFQYPLMDSEYAVGCCPTGLTCHHDDDGLQTCATVARSTTIAAAICQTSADNSFDGGLVWNQTPANTSSVAVTIPGHLTIDYSTTLEKDSSVITAISRSPISTMAIYAPLIQLVYQTSDLLGFHTTLNSTNSRPVTSKIDSLSGGAIAGIVIGALSGLVFLLALVYFLLWRRRQQISRGKSDFSKVEE